MTSLGFRITGAITIVFLVMLVAISIWGYGVSATSKETGPARKFFGSIIILGVVAVIFVVNALPELI